MKRFVSVVTCLVIGQSAVAKELADNAKVTDVFSVGGEITMKTKADVRIKSSGKTKSPEDKGWARLANERLSCQFFRATNLDTVTLSKDKEWKGKMQEFLPPTHASFERLGRFGTGVMTLKNDAGDEVMIYCKALNETILMGQSNAPLTADAKKRIEQNCDYSPIQGSSGNSSVVAYNCAFGIYEDVKKLFKDAGMEIQIQVDPAKEKAVNSKPKETTQKPGTSNQR